MRRFEAIQRIMEAVDEQPVVVNLGHAAQELYAIRDREQNFYMLGSMGLASSIGLGLALSLPGKVIAIDGDAAVTMNMGSLATIGANRPANLVLIVIDNQANGATGFQPSFTAGGLRIEDVARGCGIEAVTVVEREEDVAPVVARALESPTGPQVLVVKTDVGMPDGIKVIPMDSVSIRDRFMKSLAS